MTHCYQEVVAGQVTIGHGRTGVLAPTPRNLFSEYFVRDFAYLNVSEVHLRSIQSRPHCIHVYCFGCVSLHILYVEKCSE